MFNKTKQYYGIYNHRRISKNASGTEAFLRLGVFTSELFNNENSITIY